MLFPTLPLPCESLRRSGQWPRPSHPLVAAPRHAWDPVSTPCGQATANFHLGLTSWGKGEGDDVEDMARCLALHVLQLPCWHFPCVRNKNVNKEQVIKPAREWKWHELPEARGPGRYCKCCLFLLPLGSGTWGQGLLSVAMAEGTPSLQHPKTDPSGAPQSNKALKYWSGSSREPWQPWGRSGAGARNV